MFTPAFTRRREHMVGRAAMVGVAAAWVGEVRGGPVLACAGFVAGRRVGRGLWL